MTRNKLLAFAGLIVLIAAVLAAYRIGHDRAEREQAEAVALFSLLTVRPAITITELQAQQPGRFPLRVMVEAEGSILVIANLAAYLEQNLDKLGPEQLNALCVIAKNRDRPRLAVPYNSVQKQYLARIYQRTAREAVGSAPLDSRDNRVDCAVKDLTATDEHLKEIIDEIRQHPG